MELLASSVYGCAVLAVFIVAYIFVFGEEKFRLRKSVPLTVAAAVIWVLVAMAYGAAGKAHEAGELLRHYLLDYAEILLFLFAAMSFINTMVERNVFGALKARLVAAHFSLRTLYWVTGGLAFVISPLADNLTTALVMGSVVLAMAKGNKAFMAVASINIVVAANAGGAFSPFGDITTLMIWQSGKVDFGQFFVLFLPSLVNWLVPAGIMALSVPKSKPSASGGSSVVKQGGLVIVGLFLATIGTTVALNHLFELPTFFGMMAGLAALNAYGYFLHRHELKVFALDSSVTSTLDGEEPQEKGKKRAPFDVFEAVRDVEWDTLLFFYGVILCVGGVGAMGYLDITSRLLYQDWGATVANVVVGAFSALLDNIPLVFAVLKMHPDMNLHEWLLLTLTAGVGGSLLSIGSAAGVALMGMAQGQYTFFSHLKWTWAIALGYIASIGVHIAMHPEAFQDVLP